MTLSRLRKLLIALGVLVLLAAAALTWLVATFDPNAYKGLAIDWMKTRHDRKLVIAGPIRLSVFPRLEVEMTGVRLSEKGRTDEFATLDEVALAVRMLPLLRKKLEVDTVGAKGLRVVYTRDAQGRSNIDDLLERPVTPPEEDSASGGRSMHFDVAAVHLADMRLTLRDDTNHVAGVVTLGSLKTGRLASRVESPVQLEAQLALTSPELKGALSGKTLLTLDLDAGSVRLRDMQLGWQGDALGIRALDLDLHGGIAYDSKAGTVLADGLDLQLGASLGPLKLAGSQVAVETFRFEPKARTLALSKLKIKLAGTQGGHPLGLNLDWPNLDVKGDSLSGSALSGSLSLGGPLALNANFKSAAPVGNFDQVRMPGFEASLQGSSGPRQLGGNLHADLLLQVAKKALILQAVQTRLQIQEPSLQPLTLTAQGHASASAETAQWKLDGDINSNAFTTEGEARLTEKPLALNVTAQFKALDLNRLLPPTKPGQSPTAPETGSATGNGAPGAIDMSMLRSLQGQFSVRVGQFAYRQYRLTDATLEAKLDSGVLRVGQLGGKIWGGVLKASATADAGRNRLMVKAAANGVNVNTLLRDVADKDVLEGTGRVTLDVQTSGRNVAELKSHLAGAAALQLRDGAIKGVNLAKTLREAKATLAMKSDTRQKAVTTEKTDFSELSASFVIADGVARSHDLDIKSPFLRIGGDGAIDVGRSQLDYTLRATVASTSKGQGGAELEALKGLTVPVRLSGPLDAVQWNIRWSALATEALKSEVATRVQDKLKDKLKEQLGGVAPAPAASGPATERSPKDQFRDQLKDRLRGLIK